MTEAEFFSWLARPDEVRLVLVEVKVRVNGVETTRYLSSRPYVTGPTDTPANVVYLERISDVQPFTEKLEYEGQASLSAGDIELDNRDGALDSWLGDVWRNGTIQIWMGSPTWARSDINLIFSGVVSDISNAARDTINLALRDKLQRLNTPITEAKLGGATENKDEILPLPFGACSNVKPLYTNPATLEYGFGCPIEGLMGGAQFGPEARYNAKPVTIEEHNSAGRFNLLLPTQGSTVTVSVNGDNVGGYAPRIAPLVRRIATGYGKAEGRFTDADIDLDNFNAFDVAHPQVVGRYVADRTNQAVVIQELAASVGAQALMSRLGKLRLVQIAIPALGTPFEINSSNMREFSLAPATRPDVVAAVTIAFDRNYTTQESLQTDIPAQHSDLYAKEWLTETVTDPAVKALYSITDDPAQIETCLKWRADANAEAARRLALFKVQRVIYELDGEPALQRLELGQAVVLRSNRFGLQDGKPGIVMSLERHWITGRVTVGVMV